MGNDKKTGFSKVAPSKALKIYRNSPVTAATISKLVQDRNSSATSISDTTVEELGLHASNKKMANERDDIKNIFKLFPEFKFVADVVTTMTLSSIDLGAYNVRYKLSDNPFPSDINSRVLTTIQNHLEKEYKITDTLYDVTYECLFGSGAYAETIIPENVLDDIISTRISSPKSVGMESDFNEEISSLLNDNKSNGFLGSPNNVSMEDDDNHGFIYDPVVKGFNGIKVTDNWNLLKSSAIKKNELKSKVYEAMGVLTGSISMEDDLLFQKPQERMKSEMLKLENLRLRDPIGKPSVTRINTEAIIPVFLKSSPEDHLAYFILIDDEGLPVTRQKEDNDFSHEIEMASGSIDFQQSSASKKLSSAAKNLGLIADEEPINDEVVKKFSAILEEDLRNRLSNGIHGGLTSFTGSSELYEIMLRKTLSNIGCKLLYVPAEMMQYTALDYRINGTGTSLLHDLILVASMRAALLMSGVNSEIQSNITTTTVDIELDPNDKTPEKTIAMIKSYVHMMKEHDMQDYTLDPADINQWLTTIGVRFQVSEHPLLPNVKIDFSQEETSKPDLGDRESSLERLTKSMVMSVGLMPEILDSMQDSTFASISEANRVLMERRTYTRRKTLMKHITDKVKKIIRSDESLHKKIIAVFEDNRKSLRKNVLTPNNIRYNAKTKPQVNEWLIGLYIDHLSCSLPSQTGDDENLEEEFGKYSDSLEGRIEILLGEGSGQLLDELEEYREPALELWKNHLLRQWCVDNNYMPEVDAILQTDSMGEPLIDLKDVANDLVQGLMSSTSGFVKYMKEQEDKVAAKLAKMEEDDKAKADEDAAGTGDDDDEKEAPPADDVVEEPGETEEAPPADDVVEEPGETEDEPPEDTAPPEGKEEEEDLTADEEPPV